MSLGAELKSNARQLMFENAPKLFYISLLFMVLSTVLSELIFRLPGTIDLDGGYARLAAGELPSLGLFIRDFRPIGATLASIIILVRTILEVGFIGYSMRIRRKQETEFQDVFSGFLIFFKVLLIFIITTIFIFLWSLLFILPGIIASYRYRLAYYILLDDPRKSALQCIGESAILMKGAKADLLIIDVSFIGWHLLNFTVMMLLTSFLGVPIPIPLVSIWLYPYIGVTIAGFYEKRIIGFAA